jgi:hypothetical protein
LTCYLVFVVTCLLLSAALAGLFTWVYVTYKNNPQEILETAWNNTPVDIRNEFEKAVSASGSANLLDPARSPITLWVSIGTWKPDI